MGIVQFGTCYYYSGYSADSSTAAGTYYSYPLSNTTSGWDNSTAISGPQWITNDEVATPYFQPETPAEKRSRLRREHKEKKKYETAMKKAEKLLEEFLGKKMISQLHKLGYIELDSRKYPGKKYRVPKQHTNFIEVVDENDKVVDTLCVHPAIECPPGDHILTRVVLLQNDEEYILAKANHHGSRS